MSAVAAFSSVKLPGSLVTQAREAAQPMRRSVASQIEYWATLGQVVEHSGLTVQDAQAAIARYEAAMRDKERAQAIGGLTQRLMTAQSSGTLAQRVRSVVQTQAQNAST